MTQTLTSSPARGLHLTLPALPENVALVRRALGGLLEVLGWGAPDVSDLMIAVSEACANVCVHAYAGAPGPLVVEALPGDDGRMVVVVWDRGSGLPLGGRPCGIHGFGLPLISALAEQVTICGAPGGGTEVRMVFTRDTPAEAPAA